jgi:hypothetical protein
MDSLVVDAPALGDELVVQSSITTTRIKSCQLAKQAAKPQIRGSAGAVVKGRPLQVEKPTGTPAGNREGLDRPIGQGAFACRL